MGIDVVRVGSTYTVTKDGKEFKVTNPNDLDRNVFSDAEVKGIQDTIAKNSSNRSSATSSVSANVSVFGGYPQLSGDRWAYDLGYYGKSISYPTDSMGAWNDNRVLGFADGVESMNGFNAYAIQFMQALMSNWGVPNIMNMNFTDIFKNFNFNSVQGSTPGSTSGSDSAEVGKLKKEIEELKEQLNKDKNNEPQKRIYKSIAINLENEQKIKDIADKLYESMSGPGTDDKKLKHNITKAVNADNVIEVLDAYEAKSESNDEYNTLVEDIFDDHQDQYDAFFGLTKPVTTSKEYVTKIGSDMTERALRQIEAKGEKSIIKEEDIKKFKNDLSEALCGNDAVLFFNRKEHNEQEANTLIADFAKLIKKAEEPDKEKMQDDLKKKQ